MSKLEEFLHAVKKKGAEVRIREGATSTDGSYQSGDLEAVAGGLNRLDSPSGPVSWSLPSPPPSGPVNPWPKSIGSPPPGGAPGPAPPIPPPKQEP
jgi:hypothetical protein